MSVEKAMTLELIQNSRFGGPLPDSKSSLRQTIEKAGIKVQDDVLELMRKPLPTTTLPPDQRNIGLRGIHSESDWKAFMQTRYGKGVKIMIAHEINREVWEREQLAFYYQEQTKRLERIKRYLFALALASYAKKKAFANMVNAKTQEKLSELREELNEINERITSLEGQISVMLSRFNSLSEHLVKKQLEHTDVKNQLAVEKTKLKKLNAEVVQAERHLRNFNRSLQSNDYQEMQRLYENAFQVGGEEERLALKDKLLAKKEYLNLERERLEKAIHDTLEDPSLSEEEKTERLLALKHEQKNNEFEINHINERLAILAKDHLDHPLDNDLPIHLVHLLWRIGAITDEILKDCCDPNHPTTAHKVAQDNPIALIDHNGKEITERAHYHKANMIMPRQLYSECDVIVEDKVHHLVPKGMGRAEFRAQPPEMQHQQMKRIEPLLFMLPTLEMNRVVKTRQKKQSESKVKKLSIRETELGNEVMEIQNEMGAIQSSISTLTAQLGTAIAERDRLMNEQRLDSTSTAMASMSKAPTPSPKRGSSKVPKAVASLHPNLKLAATAVFAGQVEEAQRVVKRLIADNNLGTGVQSQLREISKDISKLLQKTDNPEVKRHIMKGFERVNGQYTQRFQRTMDSELGEASHVEDSWGPRNDSLSPLKTVPRPAGPTDTSSN